MKLTKQIPRVFFIYCSFLCLPTTILLAQSKVINTSPEAFTVTTDVADKGPVVRDVIITNTGTEDLEVYVTSRKKALAPPPSLSSALLENKKSNSTTQKPSEPPFRRHGKRDLLAPLNAKASLGGSPYQTHGTSLFAGTADPQIVELDPQNGNELRTVAQPESFTFFNDVTYDGTTFYYSDLFGISRFDATTGAKIDQLDIQTIFSDFPFLYDLATDGQYLYTTTGDKEIFKIDFDGRKVVGTIPLSFFPGEGLAHGGNRGTFFATDITSTHIYEVDLATGVTVNTIDLGDTHYFTSLTYSSTANVLFAYDEFDNPAIFVLNPQTGEVLNIIPTDFTKYYGAGLGADESYSGVFVTDRNTKTVGPGETITIPVEFSARELLVDTYEYEIVVITDDPTHPDAIIQATLHVTGPAPILVKDAAQLNFGTVFVTQTKKLSLKITNNGLQSTLAISNITTTSDRFTVDKTSIRLGPTIGNFIEVTFSPNTGGNVDANLRFETNDPNFPMVEVPLHASGLLPPVIQTGKTTLDVSLHSGQTTTATLMLSNVGNSTLTWTAVLDTDDPSKLGPVVNRLKAGNLRIAGKIPSRYDFLGGTGSGAIPTTDEPDIYLYSGNELLAWNEADLKQLPYTNGQVSAEYQDFLTEGSFPTADGTYFTVKHPGLFTFVANTDVREFYVDGQLSNKHSAVDGAVITTMTQSGIPFKGYIKRTYGPAAPSVNHLYMVHDVGDVTHTIAGKESDYHQLKRPWDLLGRTERIYYLMFSSAPGVYVDNAAMKNIMDEFLKSVAYPNWVKSSSARSGQLAPQEQTSFQFNFNTTDLSPGVYEAQLSIQSNDPNTPVIKIPVRVSVDSEGNTSPVVTSPIPHQFIPAKKEFIIDLSSHFADNEDLTYEATIDPGQEFFAYSQVDGQKLRINSYYLYSDIGITVKARDVFGETATLSFNFDIVNQAPVVTNPIEDKTLAVDERFTINYRDFFSDPNGDDLTFSVEALPAENVTITNDNFSLRAIGKSSGLTTINIKADDGRGGDVSLSFQVNVTSDNGPVVTAPIGNATIFVNDTFTIDLNEHFNDSDGDPITYSFEATPSGRVDIIALDDHRIKITGKDSGDPYGTGSASVQVVATDPQGARAMIPFNVTVTNRRPQVVGSLVNRSVHVGEDFVVDLSGYFSDPDGDTFIYQKQIFLNSKDFVGVTNISDHEIKITGKNPHNEYNSTEILVDAIDPHGAYSYGSLSFYITVLNRPPLVVAPITDKVISATEEIAVDLSGIFGEPDGEPLQYTASSSEGVSLRIDGSRLFIKGTALGTRVVRVTAKDPGQAAATIEFNVMRTDIVLGINSVESEPFYSFSPNPFSEKINFAVTTTKPGHIDLTILDSFGRVIGVPLNGSFESGALSRQVDLTGYAAGIYFYSLQINGELFNGKILKTGAGPGN